MYVDKETPTSNSTWRSNYTCNLPICSLFWESDIGGILKEYLKEKAIDYREVSSVKGGILSKLINLIYLLDYTSIYLAVISSVDPSPLRSIDFVKKHLKSQIHHNQL